MPQLELAGEPETADSLRRHSAHTIPPPIYSQACGEFTHPASVHQNYRLLLHYQNLTKMREIVHIQAGQCGNQIGAKVSPAVLFKVNMGHILKYEHDGGHHFQITPPPSIEPTCNI